MFDKPDASEPNKEKCVPDSCHTGYYFSLEGGLGKCLIEHDCSAFDKVNCDTGSSLNASNTCTKVVCDETDCCEDNFSIEIGISVCIIICICLIIGIFYVFSSRSRHKAAHKVLSRKDYKY